MIPLTVKSTGPVYHIYIGPYMPYYFVAVNLCEIYFVENKNKQERKHQTNKK